MTFENGAINLKTVKPCFFEVGGLIMPPSTILKEGK